MNVSRMRKGHKKARRREVAKFSRKEFEQRIKRARKIMTREKLDGLLVTSEANVEYLSGFKTCGECEMTLRAYV